MLMRCEPWFQAVEKVRDEGGGTETRVIMTDPRGKRFTQREAERFAALAADPSRSVAEPLHLIFMCGHYEGFDARIETLATDRYSLGDFVMTGGELAAPQYTHPPEFRGMKVPEVLLSGDHRKIEAWRKAKAAELTAKLRPDLV